MRVIELWESSRAWKSPSVPYWLGACGLLLYAAFGILWPYVGGPAETLCALLGLGMVLAYGHGLRTSGVMWLLLVALLIQILSWGLGYLHHPQWVASNPKLDRLAKLFIFIGVAWWLGGSTRNTFLTWGLALVGYLVASFTLGDGVQEWLDGLRGQRVGFGVRNLQHGSMLFGVALIGAVIFSSRFVMPHRRIVGWRAMIWLVVFGLCLTGVLIGQTRAVWLGTLMSLTAAALMFAVWSFRRARGRLPIKRWILPLAVVVVVAAISGVAFKDPLIARLSNESDVIAKVLQGDLEAVPYTSVGIRIHTWVAASEWIAERPWVGWGGEGRGLVIDHTPWLPDIVKDNFGHLHNFLIEIWVAYGVMGVMLIATLSIWIGMGTWRAWRGGVIPNDMALFGAAFFVYWMVVNQFESYNSFGTGVYIHNLIVGGLVTHVWRWQWDSGRRILELPKINR